MDCIVCVFVFTVKAQSSVDACRVIALKEARAPSSCLPEIGARWTNQPEAGLLLDKEHLLFYI